MTGEAGEKTLHAMNTKSTPAASSGIDDLFSLTLVDGLPVEAGGKTLRYRTVKLRETSVADERIAVRLSERVVMLGGVPKLLASEGDFRFAMTMRHCAAFECDGMSIPLDVLDLDVLGKLSPHDLQLIEERVVLITLAAQVRYGTLSQAEFDAFYMGRNPAPTASPQPVGQTASVGADAGHAESGPALLADFTGDAAQGTGGGARG